MDDTFVVGDLVKVTELLTVNGYPRLYAELREHIGTVQEEMPDGFRVTFGTSESAPASGYIMNSLEIERIYSGPTFLQLYREAKDEIECGRNEEGDLLNSLYRLATHPKYTHNGFGLTASRLVKAHIDRLNADSESDSAGEERTIEHYRNA